MARQFILEKLSVLDCEDFLEAGDVGGVDAHLEGTAVDQDHRIVVCRRRRYSLLAGIGLRQGPAPGKEAKEQSAVGEGGLHASRFQTIDEKPAWQLGEACSSCFVGEGDFGFLVEDQGADEAIGVAGAWHVDSYGEDPGDPLLKIGDVGGGGTFLFESALARLLVDLAARGLQVRDRRSDDYSF